MFSPQEQQSHQLEGAALQFKKNEERLLLLEKENSFLREQIRSLLRREFGKKTERWESKEQLLLLDCFNEVEKESLGPEEKEEDESTTTVSPHLRKRGKRKSLPKDLPREVLKIELPEKERVSGDGVPLQVIGWEISEKLKYEPSRLSVLEIHRAKYGAQSGDYEKTAPQIPSVIPRGLATSELLSGIITSKYCDGLPLYRLEDIFKRSGVEVSRTSMARWVVQTSEALLPVWNVLNDRLLESSYVCADETSVQVLKENGRKAEQQSWMWVRGTPSSERRIILFDYKTHRNQETVKDLFLGFKGYLQSDGLNVYKVFESSRDVAQLGCNMHGRRRFEQAATVGAKEGKSLGERGLEFYRQLYEIEESIRGKPPDERKKHRDSQSVEVWKEFEGWVEINRSKVPRKSKIGEAFYYFETEIRYLKGYLEDGRLEMDNGFVERAIRKFAIGRNNWLFSDTPKGAEASSLLYSFVVTIKVNGGDPYKTFVLLLEKIPLARTIEDYESLADFILNPIK